MKVSFKELGLVNTREMFAKAVKGGYAIYNKFKWDICIILSKII